tara:strand:+ start:61 stop:285 length:225 start_codon:yes stop_codon:yes gene_type:complete
VFKRTLLKKENIMNKVWIVEEIRNYGYSNQKSVIISVYERRALAEDDMRSWQMIAKKNDTSELYTVTVMKVQTD